MKRFAFAVAAFVAALMGGAGEASATQPVGYPFVPFGFYQPYGASFGSSLPTPPYFSMNPPVYYGARHARPYGMSPFASPPMVSAGQGYRGRLRTDFFLPPADDVEMPAPAAAVPCNPCVHRSQSAAKKTGLVRVNPYFTDSQLAKK